MPFAHELLESSISIAMCCNQRTKPQEVRFHIKAISEDVDLVCFSGPRDSNGQLPQESKDLLNQARTESSRLKKLLLELESPADPGASTSSQQPPAMDTSSEAEEPEDWRMAALEMLPFKGGDACSFFAFRDLMKENVFNNPKLNDTWKWLYFRSSLSGRPAKLISEHPPTLKGLEAALQILEHVYGNVRTAENELIGKIYVMKEAVETQKSMKSTHVELEGLFQSLVNIKHPVDNNNKIRLWYLQKFPEFVMKGVIKEDSKKHEKVREEVADLIAKHAAAQSQKGEVASPDPPMPPTGSASPSYSDQPDV